MKNNIIYKIIMVLGLICLCPRNENIALSNKFNNEIKRKVRNNYKLEREYWLEVRE